MILNEIKVEISNETKLALEHLATERKLSVEVYAKEILEKHVEIVEKQVKEDIKVALESEENKGSTNGSN